jgi:hypothetical protein
MAGESSSTEENIPSLVGLAKDIADEMMDPKHLSWLERAIANGLQVAFANVIGTVIASAAAVGTVVAKGIKDGENVAAPALAPFMAAAIQSSFGEAVPPSALARIEDAAARREIGKAIGASIIGELEGGAPPSQPSQANAEKLIGMLAHLAIDGWSEGALLEWMTSAFGVLHPIKDLAELSPRVIQATGLDELGRVGLRPLAMITIGQPLEWYGNQKYRPTQVSAAAAIRHWFRGFWTYEQMYDVLTRAGYSDAAIEVLQYDARKYFSVADAYLLTRLGKWDRSQALEHLRESGLEGDQAELELQLADAKDLRAHQDRVMADAVAAFVDGRIDLATLDNEIDHGGLDDIAKQRHRADALRRRDFNAKHLTLAQAEQAVELEVWGITDYRAYLDRVGYAHDDAITLELMLLAKLKKLDDVQKARALAAADRAAAKAARAQELQARKDALALEHADFSGSLAQAERLVVRGEMTPERYRQVLVDHGLTSDDAGALTELATTAAAEYAAAVEKRRQLALKADRQELPLSTLEQAVKRGQLSMDAFRAMLVDRKFTPDQVQLLAGVLADEIAHQAAAEQARAAAAARLATKGLSLAQEETAVRKGLKTLTDYQVFLTGAGFSSADQATLVALLQSKLVDDLRAEQLHDAAAARLEASHLSLAEEETAVKQGVKTMDDYTLFLTSHGFTADDVETLTTLLALKLGLL